MTESQKELYKMSEEQLERWFADHLLTLKVLKEKNSEIYSRLKSEFESDCEYLFNVGKIKEELLEFAKSDKNFDF